MVNKSHGFRKPENRCVFIRLFTVIVVLFMAFPNIAFARGDKTWPLHYDWKTSYKEAEKPAIGIPYFYARYEAPVKLTHENVAINLENYDNIDKTLEKRWTERHRLYFDLSCFSKFTLFSANSYGMIGYLPDTSYSQYMPYVNGYRAKSGKGGYAYHFFDYPGDGSGRKDLTDHDFYFSFRGEFDDILRQAAQKPDNLQINIAAEVLDTEGDHAHVELGALIDKDYFETYEEKIKLGHTGKNGQWVTWRGQWQSVPKNTFGLEARFYSTEGEGADANDAEVMLPRVFIRDINPPAVKLVEIQASDKFTRSTNSVYDGNSTRYRAKVGDVIEYVVTFDEPERLKKEDAASVKLQIESTKGEVYAELDKDKSKLDEYDISFTFQYTLKEGDGVLESGKVVNLINADKFVDVGKNPVKVAEKNGIKYSAIPEDKYSNRRSNGKGFNVIVDSSTPGIYDLIQNNAGGGFYALKIEPNQWNSKDEAVVAARSADGGIPGALRMGESGPGDTAKKQDTNFSLNTGGQAVFRIVLNDMIDEKLLKMANDPDPLTLKLNIFNSNNVKINGRNAYAKLIAYRYIGQDFVDKDTKGQQGTNQGYTELFFAYTPKASDFEGLEPHVYKVDIAASKSGKYFIFDTDLFNKQLSDFAGNRIGQLQCQADDYQVAPANLLVNIDLAAPEFLEDESKLPSKTANEINGIQLVFRDKGGLSSYLNVKLQVIKQRKIGKLTVSMPIDTTIAGKGNADITGIRSAVTAANRVGNDKYVVNISGMSIFDPSPALSDEYYLVYEVYDNVKNMTTNKGNGIPLNIDILPPQPVMGEDGKWYTVERTSTGETAYITFSVEDPSGFSDTFTYYTVDFNDSNASIKPGDNRIITSNIDKSSEEQKATATVTTDKDTRTSKTVYAKFTDGLGNTNSNYIPAGPINFDTRRIDAEYVCADCVTGGYRRTYDLSVKIGNPFLKAGADAGILKISYKWVPKERENDASIEFEEIIITSDSKEAKNDEITVSLTPEGFQQEWLKKLKIMDSEVFQGNYSCYTKVELYSELDGELKLINDVDLGWHQHYFDNVPPSVVFKQFPDKYAKNPVIAFQLSDDKGESNIDYGNPENTYYTYAVKRTDASGNVQYTGGTVSVKIVTDQPVSIQKSPSVREGSALDYMRNKIKDFLLDGFTYWYDGQFKTLTLEELELRRFDYWQKCKVDEELWDAYFKFMDEIVNPRLDEIMGPYDGERWFDDEEYRNEYEGTKDRIFNENYHILVAEFKKILSGKGLGEDFYLFGNLLEGAGDLQELQELKLFKSLFEELGVYILSDEGDDYYYYPPDDFDGETDEEYDEAIRKK